MISPILQKNEAFKTIFFYLLLIIFWYGIYFF